MMGLESNRAVAISKIIIIRPRERLLVLSLALSLPV